MSAAVDRETLTSELKQEARRLGFELAGACPAATPVGFERFQQWLAAGYAGEMHYLPDRAEAYRHPDSILEGARSLLMLAMPYRTAEPAEPRPGEGRVSRYAWGADYHDLIRDRLAALADWLRRGRPRPGCAAWSTRRRCWSGTSPCWPGSAGSARTRCC